MPLRKGKSSATVSKNISEFHTGKTYAHTLAKFGKERADKQAIAVALNAARKSRASGGFMPRLKAVPSVVRHVGVHTGPIVSTVPGRTDLHASKVPSGAYVVPAHAVSHLGQSNTLAGFSKLNTMIPKSGPYNTPMPTGKIGRTMPPAVRLPRMKARGGQSEGGARGEGIGVPTEINAAGGEFVISPDDIIDRYGSLEHGHDMLDKWTKFLQQQHAKTIKNLPGPARD